MSDLISKSALIEELKDCLDEENIQHTLEYFGVYDIIRNQPTVEAKPVEWIPCSDRLPEECEQVLVWFEYFRYGDYNRLYQTIGISYTFDGKWSGFVNGQSGWHKLRIIAWQPLPTPYNSKRGGKNE